MRKQYCLPHQFICGVPKQHQLQPVFAYDTPAGALRAVQVVHVDRFYECQSPVDESTGNGFKRKNIWTSQKLRRYKLHTATGCSASQWPSGLKELLA